MKLKVFNAYDSKAGFYMETFCARSRGEAIRLLDELSNKADHVFSKHPADFTFFEIGDYDMETGIYRCYDAKQPLGTPLDFKSKPKDDDKQLSVEDFRKLGSI